MSGADVVTAAQHRYGCEGGAMIRRGVPVGAWVVVTCSGCGVVELRQVIAT